MSESTVFDIRFRFAVLAVLIAIAVILLGLGIYGSYIWTFPVIVAWHFVVRRGTFAELGFGFRRLWLTLPIGAVTGIVFGIACGELIALIGVQGIRVDQFAVGEHDVGSSTGYQLAAATDGLIWLPVYFGYYILLVGLGEEIVWRGLIQTELSRRTNRHAGILLAGLAFGLVHAFLLLAVPVVAGLSFMGLIAAGGIFWGYLYDHFRCMFMLALSHGLTSGIIWKFYFFA